MAFPMQIGSDGVIVKVTTSFIYVIWRNVEKMEWILHLRKVHWCNPQNKINIVFPHARGRAMRFPQYNNDKCIIKYLTQIYNVPNATFFTRRIRLSLSAGIHLKAVARFLFNEFKVCAILTAYYPDVLVVSEKYRYCSNLQRKHMISTLRKWHFGMHDHVMMFS